MVGLLNRILDVVLLIAACLALGYACNPSECKQFLKQAKSDVQEIFKD